VASADAGYTDRPRVFDESHFLGCRLGLAQHSAVRFPLVAARDANLLGRVLAGGAQVGDEAGDRQGEDEADQAVAEPEAAAFGRLPSQSAIEAPSGLVRT
jgi:hypothetical protein